MQVSLLGIEQLGLVPHPDLYDLAPVPLSIWYDGPSFTLSKTMCVVTAVYTDLLSSFMRNETQASAYHLINYGDSLPIIAVPNIAANE